MRVAARILRIHGDAPRIHHSIVRTGALVSSLAALLLAVGGLIFGDVRIAVGPATVAMILTIMVFAGWEKGVAVTLLAGGIVVAEQQLIGTAITETPAVVALITLGAVLAVLVDPARRILLLPSWAVVIFVAPAWWGDFTTEGIVEGVVALLSFLLVAPLAITVRNVVAEGDQRYRNLFEVLPITVLEQDWGTVKENLNELREQGVTDLRGHLEENPDLVARLVSNVETIDANPAAVEMLGAPDKAHVTGRLKPDRITPLNQHHFVDQLVAIWESRPTFRNHYITHTYSGDEFWVELRWADTAVHGGNDLSTVIVVVTDVTEAKVAEARHARLAKLRGELIDAVGHELRTPLSVVMGLAEQLATSHRAFDEGELESLLNMLAQEAGSVSTIVDNLIVASLMEAGELRTTRKEFDLIDAARIGFSGIDLRLAPGCPGTLWVTADRDRIDQLLKNILTNFAHYGGKSLEISGATGPNTTWMTFATGGRSLDAGEIKRVFDTDDVIDGGGLTTGFGLALRVSRRLAEEMGGRLTYDEVGGQPVFRLELPRSTGRQIA